MEPQLAAYIARGEVKFVYQHRVVLGPESQWAAEAVECAGEQGKFWAYHDKLFNSQRGEGQGAFSKANLKGFARDLGLDTSTFASCLDTGKYASKVKQQDQKAANLGVQGTPSFLLNGKLIKGLPTARDLLHMVDEELKK